jgi:hypothetical protein
MKPKLQKSISSISESNHQRYSKMKFFAVLASCIVGACAAPLTSDEASLIKSSFLIVGLVLDNLN